jgi:hypothetical protein
MTLLVKYSAISGGGKSVNSICFENTMLSFPSSQVKIEIEREWKRLKVVAEQVGRRSRTRPALFSAAVFKAGSLRAMPSNYPALELISRGCALAEHDFCCSLSAASLS